MHQPLPEQYIWTAGDAAALQKDNARYLFAGPTVKAEAHYFRTRFSVAKVPREATLYIAGPRSAKVYLNGQLVDDVASDITSPLGMHVFTTDIVRSLKQGENVLALEVVRGRGIPGVSNNPLVRQQTFGEVLVAKIVPATKGVSRIPILMSGPGWKSSTLHAEEWQLPEFNDAGWPAVQTLGAIESSLDFFQWNADAGLYAWPGYDGISPFLAHYSLTPRSIPRTFLGRSRFENLNALTGSGEFAVSLPAPLVLEHEAPFIMLDFGREVAGRLEITSNSDAPCTLALQYGESETEADGGHYLGTNLIFVPPHATVYGPKSGFRYAKVWFLAGKSPIRFQSISLDGIYYPVDYQGSFESSDELLNRIWETGAYTAHLCMQDDIWDAPKRDRGRWMGDLDVAGRVISSVFADHFLMEDTLCRLIGEVPVEKHLNNIPGYSALWITEEADYYRHTGSKRHLSSVHEQLLQLLQLMDKDLDEKNLLINPGKLWLFVDWSVEFYGDTPEVRRATEFEYYKGYREGAYLLRELGDGENAAHFEARAEALKEASQKLLLDKSANTFGPRWQTNAMAVLSGIANEEQRAAIWDRVLSSVGVSQVSSPTISPYYNYYVISAMSALGHRTEALNWLRRYWGGMLELGATSFWESFDLGWPKHNFHTALQADGTAGYFVSLAHGWSAGPTAWLMEQVLGIKPGAAGFAQVTIRPDLIDLDWAKGAEPTPNGLIRISMEKRDGFRMSLDLPQGVEATMLIPVNHQEASLFVNDHQQVATSAENSTRMKFVLRQAGHYEIKYK